MSRSDYITRCLLVAFMLAGPLNHVLADDDYVEARRLRESGTILPLETILENVRRTLPGKILDVELEKDNGRIVYEVEVLGENGIVTEAYIDATSGELIFSKKEH